MAMTIEVLARASPEAEGNHLDPFRYGWRDVERPLPVPAPDEARLVGDPTA